MEEAATFAVCRMIRHDVSHQRSYKPSIGLPRSARAGQANARDQVSLRVEGQFPQRPKDLETSGIGQLRKDGFGYITVRKVQGIGDQDQPRFGERDAPQAKHHGFQHFPIRIEPQGVNARVTNVVVRLFKYVALRSILSTSPRVTKSTRPTPVALPCEASERSSTETYRMRGLSISGSPVSAAV